MTIIAINGKTIEEWEAERKEHKPVKACKWYDRHERLWEIWLEDEEGNQIGDCEYCCGKDLAEKIRKEMEEKISK